MTRNYQLCPILTHIQSPKYHVDPSSLIADDRKLEPLVQLPCHTEGNIIQLTVTFTTCEIFKIYRQAISSVRLMFVERPLFPSTTYTAQSHTHTIAQPNFGQHCLFNGVRIMLLLRVLVGPFSQYVSFFFCFACLFQYYSMHSPAGGDKLRGGKRKRGM